MAYRRTLKYIVTRVEGHFNEEGDLIGEEPQQPEAIYYPFELHEWNKDQRCVALGCLRNYTREQIDDMIRELRIGQAKDESEPQFMKREEARR